MASHMAQEAAKQRMDRNPQTYDNTRVGQGMVDASRDGNTGMMRQVRTESAHPALNLLRPSLFGNQTAVSLLTRSLLTRIRQGHLTIRKSDGSVDQFSQGATTMQGAPNTQGVTNMQSGNDQTGMLRDAAVVGAAGAGAGAGAGYMANRNQVS